MTDGNGKTHLRWQMWLLNILAAMTLPATGWCLVQVVDLKVNQGAILSNRFTVREGMQMEKRITEILMTISSGNAAARYFESDLREIKGRLASIDEKLQKHLENHGR